MNKKLKILLFCVGLFGIILSISAQSKEEQKKQLWEEMKAKRAAFFTQRIGLTSTEAQAFWPVYYELQGKKGELHNKMMEQFKNLATTKDGKTVFDFAQANENLIGQKFQEARLEKIYFERFKTILPPEKVFKYYAAEREWANQLLKDIENRGPK
jgi:hypothetical protein